MKKIPLFAASALALSTSMLTMVAAPSIAQSVRNSSEAPPSDQPRERGRRNREAAPTPTGNPAVSRAFITALTPVNTAITAQDWAGADVGL
ncbi:MAG: hypothetical protein ABL874_13595, partial [Sphingopyxis sp.]